MSNKIIVFDTTLRDGEQAAGTRLGAREKLTLARQLERLQVDVIEAGFPASSPEDAAAVALIAQEVREPIICGLTRAVQTDIDACAKALEKASHPRIHTGIGVSDIHVMGKFGDVKYGHTIEEKKAHILDMATNAVRHARTYVDDVEFYAEDAGRADQTYLFAMIEAVIEAGATVVNIPDTTGFTLPDQYGALIRSLKEHVPNIDQAIISVHCHDDLGLAVANTIAGLQNGAGQFEGTLNGIGERAGNAALEEVVMTLRTRQDAIGLDTRINTKELYRTSRMVSDAMGMPIPANKAIIGENAFAHSSGIHVDGVLKERTTYEIMSPEDVGMSQSQVVLTARTGRHGVRHRLEALGHSVSTEELEQIYQRFLVVADKKREVFDDDLIAILHDEIRDQPEVYRLEEFQITTGTKAMPTASVKLRENDQVTEGAACGDGPVDALFGAIASVANITPRLVEYDIRSVTSGTEALGEVTVKLAIEERQVIGRGAATDIIEASAKAYIDGLNKLARYLKG
ncbi:MAG: 2-isopropylmalate synthase [Candidatus Latescibacterota bacterium]|jgi:2-isopropylmalate synthase